MVPAILPPPAPFKIFVLLAGVARMSLPQFWIAVAVGRGVRVLRRRPAGRLVRRAGAGFSRVPRARRRAGPRSRDARRRRRLHPVAQPAQPPRQGRLRRSKPMSVAYNPGRRRMAHDTLLPDLSVVIPIRNEAPNLRELHRELDETLQAWGRPYELVHHRRRQHRRELRDPARARRPAIPHLRVIRFRRNFGQTAAFSAGFAHARGRDHRDVGRRPAERPARHPRARRRSRARPRHRLRLAQEPQGHVADAPPAVDARQQADLEGHRRRAARLRLLAQGVSGGGRQAAAPVRRDAPLHPGDRQRHGRDDRRARRQPPRAPARPFEIRALADRPGRARPADGQVPAAATRRARCRSSA